MRFSIPGEPYLYATACQVRHEDYAEWHKKDNPLLDEVKAYLVTHPDATRHDIQLECHMSEDMVRRLLRRVRG